MVRLPSILSLALVFIAICVALATDSRAVTTSESLAEKKQASKQASQDAEVSVDRESETIALSLVEAHLPELKSVLKRLRSDQPREYERAIRDLAKSARRLDLAKKRDERLYEIEVDLVQAQNQVNLLTAKLKVRDSKADRARLREAAAMLQAVQITRAEYDVELFRGRLERMQKLFDTAEKRLESKRHNPQEALEKTYLGLLRKAGRKVNP